MNVVESAVHDPEHGIDRETLRRLGAAWPRRATVRTDLDRIAPEGEDYDPAIPDYPVRFLPFAEHPDFLAGTPEQQHHVLTMAWLVYNERVITAEEMVANPTFARVARGEFPGAGDFSVKQAVQQAHIDETWHTYLHMLAMQRTRELRQIGAEPEYPHAITYRELVAAQNEAAEEWERRLLALVWTVVSEISVNAYLELLSRDTAIQPMHALVTRLHSRDEAAHSPVMIEVAKAVYPRLGAHERAVFDAAVPKALNAFTAQDFAVWPSVLKRAGYARADQIVEDARSAPGTGLLVRDFSGVRRLIRELSIDIRLGDDFGLGDEA